MPDLQEVFRMSTQKVRQDPDAMERQLDRQHRAARNRKTGTFVLVGIITVAVILVITSLVDGQGGRRRFATLPPTAPQTGPQFLDLQTGEMSPLPENIGGGYTYVVSPDGTMFAYNPCCTFPVTVSVAAVDGTDVHQVTPDGVDAYGARWLPDGDSLVYQGRDASASEIGNLFVVNVVTGDTTRITDLEPKTSSNWFLSPEPSPDGKTILFHLPRGPFRNRWDLWSIPVTGGEPTLQRRNASFGAYAPNGKIAFLGAPRDFFSPTLFFGSVCTCTDGTRLLAEGDAISEPQWSPDGTRIVYADGGNIHVLEFATGASSVVAEGARAEWFDDDTLVVIPV